MKKFLLVFMLLLVFLSLGLIFYIDSSEKTLAELNETMAKDVEVVFCPSEECLDIYVAAISSAQREVKCAFYELEEKDLIYVLQEKAQIADVRIIVDDEYLDGIGTLAAAIRSDLKRGTKYNNYMHHKFCIIDDDVLITGSANPTSNGFFRNDNDILLFHSKNLALAYEEEFDQMWGNSFGPNKKRKTPFKTLRLFHETQTYELQVFFCPQDDCERKIVEELSEAEESIYFASFVLTNDVIENSLLEKAELGVEVVGVIERRTMNSQGSRIRELNLSFPVHIDHNSATMHHKLFIIDGKTIITGSMNPSNAGAFYNDENLLIISNDRLARMYVERFQALIP